MPPEHGSAFRPACFTLAGVQAPGGIDIEIRSGAGNEPLGVKRIYSSGEASVNVAPYVRRLLEPSPMCGGAAGIHVGTARTATCFLFAPGFVSETVTLCGGSENALPNILLSAAPSVVKIAPGEKDEMGIISGDRVYCDISFSRGEIHYIEPMGQRNAAGMLAAVIDADAVCRAYASRTGGEASEPADFTVRLRLDQPGFESAVIERKYILERNVRTGRRLAWINRYGAVDYHTFPVCEEFRSGGGRSRIETPAGYRTVATRMEQSLKLLSEPCDAPTAEWLSELFSSLICSPLQPTIVSVTVSPAALNVSRKF